MGDIAVTVARWALKFSFFSALAIALIVLLGVFTSYLIVGFNVTVLGDVFALIQIWLPFNLNVILVWLTIATTSYLLFRLSYMVFNIVDQYLGGK